MESNEKVMELKRQLIRNEISIDEYNSRLREYEEEGKKSESVAEQNAQEEAADESAGAEQEEAEESAENMQLSRKEQAGACECPKKPYGLYAIIGILAFFLAVSMLTGGFGLRATGSSIADNAVAGVQDSAPSSVPADPSIGPSDAKVIIVEYSDFECPFCQRAEATVKQVLDEYEGRIRLIYRNYPLSFHNNAQAAAEAGELAHEQGKFWEMHAKMFENRLSLKKSDLKQYAEDVGLDMEEFNAGLESGRYKAEVERDIADGNALGVEGVPAFFINGRPLIGAQPIEEFRKIIDEELAKAI